MSTWVHVPEGSDFPIQNLPYGVFTPASGGLPRVGVAIGEQILDLAGVADAGLLQAEVARMTFASHTLNAFMSLGRSVWQAVRADLFRLLGDESWRDRVEPHLHPQDGATLHLPIQVADYVDFYSSRNHAENVGSIFRPDGEPLTPNWLHLPIGYHGRSATIIPSGTDIVRPSGQRKAPSDPAPTYGPSIKLDIEAEVGFVVGVASEIGSQVSVADFRDHVFGVVMVNDWSARDLQAWEYVPLGPFLGKSFATTISPWVVTLDALDAARVPGPAQTDPTPLPYLQGDEDWGLDLAIEVEWNGTVVARPPFASMYWSPAQQLAHMTVNGANVRTGDLYASGTVSGPEKDQRGSFLELSWNGTEPITLDDGSTRTFLEDGDEIVIRATAPGAEGSRIGFGPCAGRILPAIGS